MHIWTFLERGVPNPTVTVFTFSTDEKKKSVVFPDSGYRARSDDFIEIGYADENPIMVDRIRFGTRRHPLLLN